MMMRFPLTPLQLRPYGFVCQCNACSEDWPVRSSTVVPLSCYQAAVNAKNNALWQQQQRDWLKHEIKAILGMDIGALQGIWLQREDFLSGREQSESRSRLSHSLWLWISF